MSLIKLSPYIIDSTLDFTFNNVTATGNLVSLNANLGNLATANYFSGNGSSLSGIVASNITGQVANALVAGTVYTNAQPNITSVGTLTSLTATGNVTAGNLITSGSGGNISGANNITANFFIGNGASLSAIAGANVTGQVGYAAVANSVAVANVTGIGNIATINKDGNASNILYGNGVFAAAPAAGSSYGNANVATFLASFGSNTITTTGNITAGNLVTSGSSGNISGANVITANSFVASSAVNFTSASNVSLGAAANVHITGGTSGQYLKTDGAGNLSWSTVSGGGSSTLAALTDVQLTSPTNNQVLSYDSANSKWVNKTVSSGGGGGASVTVSATAPSTPNEGDMWLDSNSGDLNVYFGGAWGSVSDTSPQFVSIVNSFTGDSVTTSFTLTSTPMAKEYTLVAIGGVLQPRNTYSLSGNVITFSSAVPSSTPVEVTILGGTGTAIASAATVTTNAQPNITSVGTLTSLSVSGNVDVTGNLTVNGAAPATTGKSIAMAIVFGF